MGIVPCRPIIADLGPELRLVQQRWLELKREERDAFYAREFAAPFARLFAALPLHGAPPQMTRPRALVSVLGFSWQPVALMASWVRPERMLVLGTKDSLAAAVSGEGVLSLVARIGGISRDAVAGVKVGDPGEEDLYRAVREFVRSSGIPPRQVFVDPTGGKKSMSACAALAGFLAGTPIVYVDYTRYDEKRRIPVAGTEYPRLLANPLDVLGDLELRDIFAAFDRGDFGEAGRLAERLGARLYEPREAECLAALAGGYGAWDRFEFGPALEKLRAAGELLERFAEPGGWSWAPRAREGLRRNVPALETLAVAQERERPERLEEGAAILAWFLAAASRHLTAGKPSLALLLAYAAVEHYVDLCLWVDFGLDDDRPDYSRIAGSYDGAAYDRAGSVFFGKEYRPGPPSGSLMFASGAQLLAALSPERLPLDHLGPLRGMSAARNRSEFAHGLRTRAAPREDVVKHVDLAGRVCAVAFGGREALDRMVESLRFPVLAAGTQPFAARHAEGAPR